jgi:hypothetical protein
MATNRRDARTVASWRRRELMDCGFPRTLAGRVARDERYDLHQLIELVAQGCSPDLAVRILSPIEATDALPEAAPQNQR